MKKKYNKNSPLRIAVLGHKTIPSRQYWVGGVYSVDAGDTNSLTAAQEKDLAGLVLIRKSYEKGSVSKEHSTRDWGAIGKQWKQGPVVPGALGNVKVTASGTKVTATWKAGADAAGYYVFRATDKNALYEAVSYAHENNDSDLKQWVTKYKSKYAMYKKLSGKNTLSFTETVTAGKTYYYVVVSYSKDGENSRNASANIKQVAVPATYKVTFNKNGGSSLSIADKTVTNGKTYGTLATATRKGYTFKGWYTAKTGGTKISSTTKVSLKANQTLYAQWTKVSAPAKAGKPTLTNVSGKKMTVKWSKVSGATGYCVTYSTSSNFKGAKNVYVTSTAKTISKTITGLSKGKTYYVKVRAYKVDSTKSKVYGAYGTAGKLKITK